MTETEKCRGNNSEAPLSRADNGMCMENALARNVFVVAF